MDNEDLYLSQIANKEYDAEKPRYLTRYNSVYKLMISRDVEYVRERKRLYMQQYRSKMKEEKKKKH
jgi:hypothetical protein